MSWFSRSKEAPIVDLAVPSSNIPRQDPLRSDPRRFEFQKDSSGKMKVAQKDHPKSPKERVIIQEPRSNNNPDEELHTVLSEIKDLVLQKFDDPSTVDGFIRDLRTCIKGRVTDTKNTVNTLLGHRNLTQEDFALLSSAIVSCLLDYQANYGWPEPAVQQSPVVEPDQRPVVSEAESKVAPLAENHHKTASGPNRDRALSCAPPASSASSRLRSATQVSPNYTRARPTSSVSAPGHKGVHGKVKDEDLTIIITQRKFTNGTFHYLTSKSAHSLDLPPAAIPGHEPKPGDVYLHENSTKLSDSATQNINPIRFIKIKFLFGAATGHQTGLVQPMQELRERRAARHQVSVVGSDSGSEY
ncbi:hypothetical protein B0H14DRAFT_2598243 [Mycena olivaceomarginata]|nr:hypothetical protein B0H14DRAFT_2598243 [Mycena olivaceomarginata]